jgi:general secretion pathway protein A
MEYFKILNLIKEPFSNSPEPELFYQSPQHVDCLQKLELAVRLRRGLNVVIGDVGTGKTTLCRQLIQRFSSDENIETHLLLDPHFSKSSEFLYTLSEMLTGAGSGVHDLTEWELRERIKNHLFDKGVGKDQGIILIIDEGQKIPDFGIEILRELLNYETNEYKLLQIVIFAQKEFRQTLDKHPGFEDRIDVSYGLGPLNFRDTRSMIRYRLEKSSEAGKSNVKITYSALRAIFRFTEGYPRKIVTLCHQIILALIIQNKNTAGWFLVKAIAGGNSPQKPRGMSWANVTILSGLILIIVLLVTTPERLEIWNPLALKYLETEKTEAEESITPSGFEKAVAEESEVTLRKDEDSEVVIVPSQVSFKTEKEDETVVEVEVPDVSVTSESSLEDITQVIAEKTVHRSASDYPDILGQLAVEKRGVIWFMIQDVYGICDMRHLKLVKKVNPHIGNLSKVFAGDIINFPSIPAETKFFDRDRCLVEIAEKEDLREAYALLKGSSGKSLPPMQLIPHWNSYGGLKFSLILKEEFGDEESAQEALDRLPVTVSSGARIIEQWEEGTVIFSCDVL